MSREPMAVHPPLSLSQLHAELAATMSGDRGGARDLLAALLGKPRFWPTAHGDEPVPDYVATRARDAAAAMGRGVPFAYAVGRATFRHLELVVDPRVLIPRPETELLVDLAIAVTGGKGTIADVGTGSGAIALALAAEGTYDRVVATDVSPDALAVARGNLAAIPEARRGTVEFREGDVVTPLAGESFGMIVSNPPYIARDEMAELPALVADHEPHLALFADDGGMQVIARLFREAPAVLAADGWIAVEVDSRRAQQAADLAKGAGWRDARVHTDLTGRERFVLARRPHMETR